MTTKQLRRPTWSCSPPSASTSPSPSPTSPRTGWPGYKGRPCSATCQLMQQQTSATLSAVAPLTPSHRTLSPRPQSQPHQPTHNHNHPHIDQCLHNQRPPCPGEPDQPTK